MRKLKKLALILVGLSLLGTTPAKADLEHSLSFTTAYTYLFTNPNAHMGTFGIGYDLKTDSNITFSISGYGGYGKLLTRAGTVSGFGLAGAKALPGFAIDITDSIYLNLATGLGFSFTSSKIAVSILDKPASIVSIKWPFRAAFVFEVLDNFHIVSGIEYAALWQNGVSFSTKINEKWRFANEIALLLDFRYVF